MATVLPIICSEFMEAECVLHVRECSTGDATSQCHAPRHAVCSVSLSLPNPRSTKKHRCETAMNRSITITCRPARINQQTHRIYCRLILTRSRKFDEGTPVKVCRRDHGGLGVGDCPSRSTCLRSQNSKLRGVDYSAMLTEGQIPYSQRSHT